MQFAKKINLVPRKPAQIIASSHPPGRPGGAGAGDQARTEERTPGGDDQPDERELLP